MARAAFIAGVVLFAFLGFIQFFYSLGGLAILIPPSTTGPFDEMGTIDITTNSTGQRVAYLVYEMPTGLTATKALAFTSHSECDTPQGTYPCPLIASNLPVYYGNRVVHVYGTTEAEHVNVDMLQPKPS